MSKGNFSQDYYDGIEYADIVMRESGPVIACRLAMNDGHGQYIPAKFIECYDPMQWGVTEKDQKELSSPDNRYYWETWESVEQYAIFTDEYGNK